MSLLGTSQPLLTINSLAITEKSKIQLSSFLRARIQNVRPVYVLKLILYQEYIFSTSILFVLLLGRENFSLKLNLMQLISLGPLN